MKLPKQKVPQRIQRDQLNAAVDSLNGFFYHTKGSPVSSWVTQLQSILAAGDHIKSNAISRIPKAELFCNAINKLKFELLMRFSLNIRGIK